MQEHRHNQIDTAHRISLQNVLLKGLSALLFVIAFYGITAAQTTYTFTGEEDDRYENAANWMPAYPGTEIASDAVVMIEADVFAHETLQVAGKLHVTVGSILESDETGIVVLAGGKLMNDGEIYATYLENAGIVNNNFSAILTLGSFSSEEGSMTNNLMSAEMMIDGDAVNGGTFNNYSLCTIGREIKTSAEWYNLKGARLQVAGETATALSFNGK